MRQRGIETLRKRSPGMIVSAKGVNSEKGAANA